MLTDEPVPPCSQEGRKADGVANPNAAGLACPACGSRRLAVAYTRPGAGGTVRRRRRCQECGARFVTREETVPDQRATRV
jgi:DNA-directed RNA polymerase subunit RPC12/RpoP